MATLTEQIEEAEAAWADEDLLKIWVILSTPDVDPDTSEAILGEDDIERIAGCVARLNEKMKALQEATK